jgi:glycosyltransferase involved in cell wall biosynthesis
MKIALVHDWLIAHRGGERVLLEIARLFPQAPIYTLVCDRTQLHPELQQRQIVTSFIQRLPQAPQKFRAYLPLFPAAAEAFDLSVYDCIISSSHCVAKGVRSRPHQMHLSYVHTPMRYLWDQMAEYLPSDNPLLLAAARIATAPLRRWDVRSAQRPTAIVANSRYVAKRIERFWKRDAQVVYPPVDTAFFDSRAPQERHGYLVVSALVPYKRVDWAVQCATELNLPLTVIGEGPEFPRLKRLAGKSVRFLGSVSMSQLQQAYGSAKAFLFCGVEDFGIAPVEALASGCPVIAFAEGGATETVTHETGMFFKTRLGLADAIKQMAHRTFDIGALKQRAKQFSQEQFVSGFKNAVESMAPGITGN